MPTETVDTFSPQRGQLPWGGEPVSPLFKLGAATTGTGRLDVPGRTFVLDADAPRER